MNIHHLKPFVIFYGRLLHFPSFGTLYREQSGNPVIVSARFSGFGQSSDDLGREDGRLPSERIPYL
jgi:hypothetical protein